MLEKWIISWKVCKGSLVKWKSDPRIWCVLALIVLFEWIRLEPIHKVCEMMGLCVSCWYFPFLTTGDIHQLFYFLGILILFCNAPFIDNQQMFVILRVGRRNWFRGKMMYIVLSSAFYFGVMYVISIIGLIPNVGFSMEWESVLEALSMGGTLNETAGAHEISRLVITQLSPLQATLEAYVICVLVAVLLGFSIFFINLFGNNNLGIGVGLFVILWSMFIENLPYEAYYRMLYLSPISWTDISIFLKDVGGVPFWYALLFLVIANSVLAVLIMIKAKSYNMEVMEEV